jgi:hypothetical protein
MSSEHLYEALAAQEESFEKDLLRKVPDALLNDGEQIYIRRFNGRLQWLKANVHGGGQEWEELTPYLAKDRLTRGSVGLVDAESLEKLRDMLTATQNPEAYEIGWYQDLKGDLYQFDGKTWLGRTPGKNEIKTLEYLG